MLASTVLSSVLLSITLVSCQVTPVTPTEVSQVAGEVDATTRATWCNAQLRACNLVCDQVVTNTCDSTSLVYSCTCAAGNTPDFTNYAITIPSFVCNTKLGDCLVQGAGSADQQEECKASYICGDLALPSGSNQQTVTQSLASLTSLPSTKTRTRKHTTTSSILSKTTQTSTLSSITGAANATMSTLVSSAMQTLAVLTTEVPSVTSAFTSTIASSSTVASSSTLPTSNAGSLGYATSFGGSVSISLILTWFLYI